MQETSSQTSEKILRPPIVVVLGHVDHGKTSLLDKIRNTNVTSHEAGGITQSIGTWTVQTKQGKEITFIDTPGHAAFEGMRARGAKIADLAILVIAADDGIMPQTKQSIAFIKEAKIPFLVVITKVDLPSAQVDKVKKQLLELEIVVEEYGGDIVVVEVSGKTGQGVDELLEMIGLLSEMISIANNPQASLKGYILEAERDPRRGVVATIVVCEGTLKVGDKVSADGVNGKVRGLFDGKRKSLKEVSPGRSAQVIGFAALPSVGSVVVAQAEKQEETKEKQKTLNISEGFSLVLKTDTAGSLEAIQGQLGKEFNVVTFGLGDLADSDISTASATGATIVGFNIKVSKEIQKLAEEQKVKICTYKIIYELLEDVERQVKESRQVSEKILGRAEIVAEFTHSKTEKIAGCKVVEGRITKSDRVRIVRGEEHLGNVKIESLKKQRQEVDSVALGSECGILFHPQFDFQIRDVLESVL